MTALEDLHRLDHLMLGAQNQQARNEAMSDLGGGKERAGNVRLLITTKQGRERMRGVPIMAQGVGGTQQDTSPTGWIDELDDDA